MNYLKVTYGNPVTSTKGITEQFHISDRTARTIIREMEERRDRYGDMCTFGEGALKRINILCFTDYYRNRKALQEPNIARQLPDYDPAEVARQLGFYGTDEGK